MFLKECPFCSASGADGCSNEVGRILQMFRVSGVQLEMRPLIAAIVRSTYGKVEIGPWMRLAWRKVEELDSQFPVNEGSDCLKSIID